MATASKLLMFIFYWQLIFPFPVGPHYSIFRPFFYFLLTISSIILFYRSYHYCKAFLNGGSGFCALYQDLFMIEENILFLLKNLSKKEILCSVNSFFSLLLKIFFSLPLSAFKSEFSINTLKIYFPAFFFPWYYQIFRIFKKIIFIHYCNWPLVPLPSVPSQPYHKQFPTGPNIKKKISK